MANPIQKGDLISDEALKALEEMSRLLREDKENMDALMASFKQYAGSIQTATTANNGNNDALAAALQKVSELEKAYSDLQKLMKENAATQRSVAAEKRKYAKLTEEEAAAVRSLAQGWDAYAEMVKKGHTVTLRNKEDIDIQNKSYNELYQTYNALKDALNKLTTEQRTNTDVGKYMTAQALKIRDTMNEMQKATGNYTLQVGKYRAAFDGLGYSFQQILREAPSALNFNQFFLAISNNIPMFLDQLKAFNAEQAEIKTNLAQMTEGTKEYAEQLSKVESVGKKLGRTLLSWQSLVLVGLLVIRNWERIVSGISDLFYRLTKEQKALREVNQGAASTVGELTAKYKALQKEWNNLKDADKGSWVKQHKDDWNELGISINNATDAENIYVKNTSTVQNAIDARARSIAAMKIASEKYEEAFRLQAKAEQDLASGKMGFGSSLSISLAGAGMAEGSGVLTPEQQASQERARKQSIKAYYENQMKAVKKLQEEAQYYITTWVLPDPLKPNKNGTGGKQPSEQEMNNQFWKSAEARRNIMLVGYQKELADEKAAHLQQMQEQSRANEEMKKAVEENVKNEKITKEEGARRIQELQKQNNIIMEGLILEHNKRVNVINTKYAELDRQVIVEEELGWIEELDEAYKVADNNRRRRIKTIKDEEISNRNITESILKMREEIEKLQEKNLTQPEAIEQRTKRVQELEKAIAKLQTQIDHTKQLSNYSSVGDIFRRNVSIGAGTQQSLMESILGKDAYSAFAPGSKEMQDAIEKDFDTWMQSVEQSVSTWYSTTMGYINDLISAYVELANAKAEAAAEATEAAQEEYDKEKALLEAGYASRVEATWAEYQEKKAAQEKAEEDAKAAAKAQQEINNLSTMGSLITAAANIWKTFTEIPVVGIPLAIAATGTMFGAFLAAKIKANEVSKYGEGGFEVLEGGSHASGHDIDLGVKNRRGRRMRAEGKEGIGIFSIRAMNRYGERNIEGWVNSINDGTFEANSVKRMGIERGIGMTVLSMPRTDLHRVENSLDKLVGYGSRSRYTEKDGTVVEVRKSGVVRYRK